MANSKNFWDGDSASTGIDVPTKKGASQPSKNDTADSVIVENKFEFNWWWVAAGALILVLIVVAVILNLNHSHTGDNAENISGTINIDNGDNKINWDRYPSFNAELSGSYKITESGTYYLSGNIDDGLININVASDAVVRLILNNVSIKNSNGPAIACYGGDDLVIELNGENYLEDGASYSADFDADVDGVIYSKADLSFSGDGTLNTTANHADAIVSKDDLKFNSGKYIITAIDDGIRGKDSVYVINGDFKISTKGDAIKSTNETDTTKGFVLIEDGNFEINAGAKGIKAINSILIYDGNFAITSTDDTIHSNNYVGIIDGTLDLASSDDGIHADARLIIDGGKINITKSYEGLEAQKISINGGEVSIYSNDDGMNAGGGADGSANSRAGAGAFDVNENCELIINGGEIYVNAAGDGIDSNGYIYINGGNIAVDGPTNNGNGALDSGASIMMNGGSVIALGASGMAETLGTSSSIYNISVYFSSTQNKGTVVEIRNSAGDIVLSHTSAKTFNHLAAGTSAFQSGETYTIYINGALYESFTVSDITTTIGNSAAGQRGQMR